MPPVDFSTLIVVAFLVVVVYFFAQRYWTLRNVVEVSVKEASAKVKAGASFIDVRSPDEYQSGHAAGVKLIPLYELKTRLNEIPLNKPIVIICASGNRSASAAAQLTQAGYAEVYSVRGGTGAWRAAQLPLGK